MNAENTSSTGAPAVTAFIALIRPRGDADSSEVRWYVGQWGKHRPHDTQASRSPVAGASSGRTHPGGAALACAMNAVPAGSDDPSGASGEGGGCSTVTMLRARASAPTYPRRGGLFDVSATPEVSAGRSVIGTHATDPEDRRE